MERLVADSSGKRDAARRLPAAGPSPILSRELMEQELNRLYRQRMDDLLRERHLGGEAPERRARGRRRRGAKSAGGKERGTAPPRAHP